jgi:hypothetical protein
MKAFKVDKHTAIKNYTVAMLEHYAEIGKYVFNSEEEATALASDLRHLSDNITDLTSSNRSVCKATFERLFHDGMTCSFLTEDVFDDLDSYCFEKQQNDEPYEFIIVVEDKNDSIVITDKNVTF